MAQEFHPKPQPRDISGHGSPCVGDTCDANRPFFPLFYNLFLFIVKFLVIRDAINASSPGAVPTDRNSSNTGYTGRAPSQRYTHRTEPYKDAQAARGNKRKINTSDDGRSVVTGTRATRPPGLTLACPCWKYNPIKYLDCLLRNSLNETSFVVQHLERAHNHHRLPIHCPTCGVIFDTRASCDAHVALRSCEHRAFAYEGFTSEQFNLLRGQNRARRGNRTVNEVERWYRLWDILYPNTPRPDSPYVGSPLQELLDMARRALCHVRENLIGVNPAATFLLNYLTNRHPGPEPYERNEVEGMLANIVPLLFNASHILSLLPNQSDLSFLTSDRLSPGDTSTIGGGGANLQPEQPQQMQQPQQPQQPQDPQQQQQPQPQPQQPPQQPQQPPQQPQQPQQQPQQPQQQPQQPQQQQQQMQSPSSVFLSGDGGPMVALDFADDSLGIDFTEQPLDTGDFGFTNLLNNDLDGDSFVDLGALDDFTSDAQIFQAAGPHSSQPAASGTNNLNTVNYLENNSIPSPP